MVMPNGNAAGMQAAGNAAGNSSIPSGSRSGAGTADRAASNGVRKAASDSNVIVGPWKGSGAPQSNTRQANPPSRSARGIQERARAAGFEYVDGEDSEDGVTRLKRSVQQAEESAKKETHYRIGLPMAALLVASAVFLDIVEIILFFSTGIGGFVKDFASWFYIIIFWALKAPFWKGNKWVAKMNTMAATYIVGIIPGISDFLPELTIGVISVIIFTRLEDVFESKIKTVKAINDKITRYKRSRQEIQDNKAA